MSTAMQAIIDGAHAAALWTSSRVLQGPPSLPEGHRGSGWACPQLVVRPRGRRPALAIRQDA